MPHCVEHLESLRTLASTIGVLSFGALAFLVAVVTVFIELNRDQIVVSRRLFFRLRWAIGVLATETLTWISIEMARVIPFPVFRCSSYLVVSLAVFMLIGVAAATILLAGFVKQIGTLVREGYQ